MRSCCKATASSCFRARSGVASHRARSEPEGISGVEPPGPVAGSLKTCQMPALPNRSACGFPARTSPTMSPARSQARPSLPFSRAWSLSSISVRSQAWLPSRGPIASDTRSPGRIATGSSGPNSTGFGPAATPAASRSLVAPRRSSTVQVTPLPHSGWACVTLPATRTAPASGLRQPTATARLGVGWTATPWARRLPGIRTSWSEAFVNRIGRSGEPQPFTKS